MPGKHLVLVKEVINCAIFYRPFRLRIYVNRLFCSPWLDDWSGLKLWKFMCWSVLTQTNHISACSARSTASRSYCSIVSTVHHRSTISWREISSLHGSPWSRRSSWWWLRCPSLVKTEFLIILLDACFILWGYHRFFIKSSCTWDSVFSVDQRWANLFAFILFSTSQIKLGKLAAMPLILAL